jgi:hypothetical protein
LSLAQETLVEPFARCLDRDVAIQAPVMGAIDFAHAAHSNKTLEPLYFKTPPNGIGLEISSYPN